MLLIGDYLLTLLTGVAHAEQKVVASVQCIIEMLASCWQSGGHMRLLS